MIGDHNPGRSGLDRHLGVGGMHEALDDHRKLASVNQGGKVVPVERSVHEAKHLFNGNRTVRSDRRGDAWSVDVDLEARAEVALAPPGEGGVDREENRLIPGLDRLREKRFGHRPVAEHVELEPLGCVGSSGSH